MALVPTTNVLVNGLRTEAKVGEAIATVTAKVTAALKGVAVELSEHDKQLAELFQTVDVLLQFHGVKSIDGAVTVSSTVEFMSDNNAIVYQDIPVSEVIA